MDIYDVDAEGFVPWFFEEAWKKQARKSQACKQNVFFSLNTVGDLQRMCGGIFKSCTTRVRNLACCAVARRTNQPNVAACICHFFIPFIIDTKAYLNTIAYDSTQQPATVL